MKTDLSKVTDRVDLLPAPQPRTLCLADLVQALHGITRDDAEVAAVLAYMLTEGHVRFAGSEALAA